MVNSILNRIELARYFNQQDFNYGAEVGVADGRYSEILCKENSRLKLLCIDPYTPYDGNWRTQAQQDTAHELAVKRLEKYDAYVIRKTSLLASLEVEDESLDFVFIDGAHDFDNTMLDILVWSKKVRPGGIISGHDYYRFRTGNVVGAVDAYVKAHDIDLFVIPGDQTGHRDDRRPCWWWRK